jgi:hypothetical protein
MNLEASTLPMVVNAAGVVVLASTPVWVASRFVDADWPTMGRAMAALTIVIGVSILGLTFLGMNGLLLAPLVFLVSIRYLMGTTVLGTLTVAMIAVIGYMAFTDALGTNVSSWREGIDEWSCSDSFPLDRHGCPKE